MRVTEEELRKILKSGDVRVEVTGMNLPTYSQPGDEADVLEHAIQARVIRWAQEAEGVDERLKLLFAVPNGGLRHPRVAVQMRMEGVKPGVPDLLLPVPASGCTGLALEMKRPKGRVRPEQEEWMVALRKNGWHTAVCRSSGEAVATLAWYLGYADPTR